jgi:hypothetical protein
VRFCTRPAATRYCVSFHSRATILPQSIDPGSTPRILALAAVPSRDMLSARCFCNPLPLLPTNRPCVCCSCSAVTQAPCCISVIAVLVTASPAHLSHSVLPALPGETVTFQHRSAIQIRQRLRFDSLRSGLQPACAAPPGRKHSVRQGQVGLGLSHQARACAVNSKAALWQDCVSDYCTSWGADSPMLLNTNTMTHAFISIYRNHASHENT